MHGHECVTRWRDSLDMMGVFRIAQGGEEHCAMGGGEMASGLGIFEVNGRFR